MHRGPVVKSGRIDRGGEKCEVTMILTCQQEDLATFDSFLGSVIYAVYVFFLNVACCYARYIIDGYCDRTPGGCKILCSQIDYG